MFGVAADCWDGNGISFATRDTYLFEFAALCSHIGSGLVPLSYRESRIWAGGEFGSRVYVFPLTY